MIAVTSVWAEVGMAIQKATPGLRGGDGRNGTMRAEGSGRGEPRLMTSDARHVTASSTLMTGQTGEDRKAVGMAILKGIPVQHAGAGATGEEVRGRSEILRPPFLFGPLSWLKAQPKQVLDTGSLKKRVYPNADI